ncbi:TIGR02099 family protein [Thiohalobacter thiocyanaticus]|uniref:TIGR02099 family protein n=1 Tax=Thiohalobacter thiocyanaticus TaxID=585455 RepID=A0A426QHN3_9GAMM|nr:YhdP family protein [Thiohalobacter thiocyanaticus]RRQ21253.1 TIGR02099 family protein [Thiohalobacter thiocyanaticus]
MLRRATRLFWYTAAALLIVAALLLSTARLVLPLLDDYHGELQQWLTQRVGHPVRIERLDLGWHGLGPELRLLDTRLYDRSGEEVLLQLEELRIGIDLWLSWRQDQLVSARIALHGSELNLIRREDGRIVLRGREHAVPLINPLALAAAQPRIEMQDVTLGWEDRYLGQPRMVFRDIALRVRNRGDRHQLELQASPTASLGRTLEVRADLVLPPEQPDRWHGRLYLNAQGFMLREWLGWYLSERWYAGGVLDARLWATLQAGRLTAAEGELAVHLPVFSSRERAAPLFAGTRLATRAHWNRSGEAWQLRLDELELIQAERAWPTTGLSLIMAAPDAGSAGGGRRVQLAVDTLPLELLQPALPVLVEAAGIPLDLKALAPQGRVRGLQLGGERHADGWRDIRFRAGFEALAWQPHARLPGVSGLSARLIGSPQRGRIELDLAGGRFTAPALFRDPIPIGRLAGRLHWQQNEDDLLLYSEQLALANTDIGASGRLRLALPRDGASPHLNLQAEIERGDAAMTGRYLPAAIMPEKTVNWLDRAIVSGDLHAGSVEFRGRLADFPFRQGEGRMEIRARVRDAILDYHPDWHRIEELNAELVFINQGMHIEAVDGAILGTRLSAVTADIPDLKRSRLKVQGRVRGPLDDMLRFLQDSPLARRGYALGQVQGGGTAGLELDLDLPLRRAQRGTTRVAGQLQLQDNRLQLPARELALDSLSGRIDFTETRVSGTGLEARLWQTPVSLELAPHPDTPGLTRVRLAGRLPLLQRLGQAHPLLARYLSGQADWRLQLDVGRQVEGYPLRIESELEGVAIDLPPPLGKPAAASRPLRLQTRIQPQGTGPLFLRLGDLQAALELDSAARPVTLDRAMLRFNDGAAELPEGPGLELHGRLDSLSVDAWREVLDGMAGGDAALPALALRRAALEVQHLEIFNQRFAGVGARVRPDLGVWRIDLDGPDIAGRIALPRADSTLPLDLDFDRLVLARGGIDGAGEDIDPARLPPLDVDITDLTYGELDLGRVRLRSEPLAHGMEVESLEVEGDWLKLLGPGQLDTARGPRGLALRYRTARQRPGTDAERLRLQRQCRGRGHPRRDQRQLARRAHGLRSQGGRGYPGPAHRCRTADQAGPGGGPRLRPAQPACAAAPADPGFLRPVQARVRLRPHRGPLHPDRLQCLYPGPDHPGAVGAHRHLGPHRPGRAGL